MRHVILVKKLKADGTLCRKCVDVLDRLERDGLARAVDRVVTADERDPGSEGMRLAARYGVSRAPFLVVEDERGRIRIFTSYFQFRRELLRGGEEGLRATRTRGDGARSSEPGGLDGAELAALVAHHPDLDFV